MSEVVASVSTIKRHRKQAQSDQAAEIRDAFRQKMPMYKVVHWDGKIVEFLGEHGHTYEDVNAVVLSAPLELKPRFLGAPVVGRGEGRQLFNSTVQVLEEWDAADGIIGAVFDTTDSNRHSSGCGNMPGEALQSCISMAGL